MITATIDGLSFSDDPSAPMSIGPDGLQGWHSGAPIKTRTFERANSDGVFGITKFFRAARVITLSGLYTAKDVDEATAVAQWQKLAGILADGIPGDLTVTDPAGTFTSEVMLFDAGTTIEPLVFGMAEYVITFLAFDPVKYSAWRGQSTGLATAGGGLVYPLHSPSGALNYGANGDLGRVTVTNAGTAEVWPRFTVTGELTNGFFIQCLETGEVVRYDRIVPAGTILSLDSRTGAVLVDGVSDGSTYLTRDDWFSIPAGQTRTIQFNAIGGQVGNPQLTVWDADGMR